MTNFRLSEIENAHTAILLFLLTLCLIAFLTTTQFISAQQKTLSTTGLVFNNDSSANISRSRSTKVQVPGNTLNSTQGWVAVRMKMGFPSTTNLSPDPIIVDISESNARDLLIYFDIDSDSFHIARGTQIGGNILSPSAHNFAQGDLKTVIAAWTKDTIKISVDGGDFASRANTAIPGSAPLLIGSTNVQGSGRQPNSDYYWVAGGTGQLTNADAVTINSFANQDKKRSEFPGNAVFIWWANSTSYNNDIPVATPTIDPTLSECNNGLTCTQCTAPSNTCGRGNGRMNCSYTKKLGGGSCNSIEYTNIFCVKNNCVSPQTCQAGSCL